MQVKWLLNKQSSRIILTGWWLQRFCMFHFIYWGYYGMSSFPLTFIFSRGVETINQSSNCIFWFPEILGALPCTWPKSHNSIGIIWRSIWNCKNSTQLFTIENLTPQMNDVYTPLDTLQIVIFHIAVAINCSFSVHWFRHSQPGDGWNWDRHQNEEFTPQKPNHRNTMFKRNLEPQFNTPFDAYKFEIGCCFPGKIRRCFFSKGIAVVPHHLTLMFFSRRIWTWRRFSSLHQ